MVIATIVYFAIAFVGFAIGRIGHIYGGHLSTPDHWIYGALLFIPGIGYTGSFIFALFFFGAGLIISDLKDFLNFKLWGPDEVDELRFWHID